jgi:hypothetical protein
MFKLKTFVTDTMFYHHLSQELKLIENDKFNHLINILTIVIGICTHNLI